MGFAERLRQIIDNMGITPYELSMRTKVSQATLSRIFANSTGKPSYRTVEALAKYLHVSPEWLLTGEGAMLKASAAPQAEPAPAGPAAAQPDMVSIPREVWEVIRNQAASLQEKDALLREKTEMLKETAESFGRRDRQIDELIALLREEIERGDDAGSLYRAASQAAAD